MSREALAQQAGDVTLLRPAFGALESRLERDKAGRTGTRMEHAWNPLGMRVERGPGALGVRVERTVGAHRARLDRALGVPRTRVGRA